MPIFAFIRLLRRALGSVVRPLVRAWHRAALRSSGVVVPTSAIIIGSPIVSLAPGSRIELGERVVLCSKSEATALAISHPVVLRTLAPGARLSIGADTGISGGSFCAATEITIGEGCLFGADVVVADTNFHPVDNANRRYSAGAETSRVVIGSNVFVGTRAIVLKGSTIGSDSVIGAGSLVAGVVPSGVVAAGNPCRVLRSLRVSNPNAGTTDD